MATQLLIWKMSVGAQLTCSHTKVGDEGIHNTANLGQGLLNSRSDWMTSLIFHHVTCDTQEVIMALWLDGTLVLLPVLTGSYYPHTSHSRQDRKSVV